MPDAKKKRKKDSFVVRMKRRGREVKSLGQTLLNEPKRFPRALLNVIRRSLRTVWDARGGGMYACGFVVTFVYLEVTTLVSEILSSNGVVEFFTEQLLEIVFRFVGESLGNMIQAFIWPVEIITYSPPWGIAILAAMYLLFTYLIKEPLAQWLFHDEE